MHDLKVAKAGGPKLQGVKVANGFHGLELDIRTFSGARAVRVIHPANQVIHEHAHDWPSLTLYLLGSYLELHDNEKVHITGPSAILNATDSHHANEILGSGLETVSIQFDPGWLGSSNRAFMKRRLWLNGPATLKSRSFITAWLDVRTPENTLITMTRRFLEMPVEEPEHAPPWMPAVTRTLAGTAPVTAKDLSGITGLHPTWLSHAYRRYRGEGIQETRRRRNVEHAIKLLRHSTLGLAHIAVASNFSDQSHMHRSIRAFTGRTPLQIRQETARLEGLAERAPERIAARRTAGSEACPCG